MTDFLGGRIIDPDSADRALQRIEKQEYDRKMRSIHSKDTKSIADLKLCNCDGFPHVEIGGVTRYIDKTAFVKIIKDLRPEKKPKGAWGNEVYNKATQDYQDNLLKWIGE